MRPNRIGTRLWRIFTLGISAFAIEVAFGVTTTVFNNKIVTELTTDHLAVYGTAATVTVMFYCLLNATGTAMQPIASQNFGAKKLTRVRASLKVALISSTVLSLTCFLFVELFPETVLRIYMDVNDRIVAIGPRIIRIYSLALPLVGITLAASFYFQSILKQWMSFTVAILRGLLLPIVLVIILPAVFGIDAIWWCMPISEGISFVISVIFLAVSNRGLKRSAFDLMHEVSV